MDIDDFKIINDGYGHCEGDEALKVFATLLVESFPMRRKKLIRLGGDEFLILLEEGHSENVAIYIQNLTEHVEEYNDREKNHIDLHSVMVWHAIQMLMRAFINF